MLQVKAMNGDMGYQEVSHSLQALASEYKCELLSIGKSVLGMDLWTLRLGQGARSVYISGAHHGPEWLTASLLVHFCQAYLEAEKSGSNLSGVNIHGVASQVSLWVTPLANPDGVSLVRNGLQDIPTSLHSSLIQWNYGRTDFREWKANLRGVDLNRQYRADWQAAYLNGPKSPAPKFFAGENPESEPESRAIASFVRALKPEFLLAYHSQGEVIYWDYKREAPPEARRIAREFSRLSGYSLVAANPNEAGSGGLKDWFIHQFRRPGFTIEIGRGVNPLPLIAFASIWKQNIPLLAHLPTFVQK